MKENFSLRQSLAMEARLPQPRNPPVLAGVLNLQVCTWGSPKNLFASTLKLSALNREYRTNNKPTKQTYQN